MVTFVVAGDTEGRFISSGPRDADQALDALLDRRDSGDLSREDFLEKLNAMVRQHPGFIDGHAHLGTELFHQGLHAAALRAAKRGLEIGLDALPSEFGGTIAWHQLENRPFLRAAHVVALAYRSLGDKDRSDELLRQMLGWNPNDNQGARLILHQKNASPVGL